MFPRPNFNATVSEGELAHELRQVGYFDSILLRDYGELTIIQGDHPAVSIASHPALLPRLKADVDQQRLSLGFGSWLDKLGEAFTTSLRRKPIRYTVTVPDLHELEVCALSTVKVSSLATERLTIKLCGAVDMRLASLSAARLAVDISGIGRLAITGQVTEQEITVDGPGEFIAPRLQSSRAHVQLGGPGQITLWATDLLDVSIKGIGQVAYHGGPVVKQHITGLGVLRPLGQHELS